MSYKEISKGVVKRSVRRELGIFIDGTGLDRATRRINRKVDMPSLVKGVAAGSIPVVARYYTLIPYEDDSRQRAFLDAVRRSNLRVVVKRLPPKGVTRQVSVDIEMAADIVAFALGHYKFSSLSEYIPGEAEKEHKSPLMPGRELVAARSKDHSEHRREPEAEIDDESPASSAGSDQKVQRIVTIVCPGRDLAYPISLVKELGVDTVTADFGQFNNKDLLKSAAKWIDLSDSETIWRD